MCTHSQSATTTTGDAKRDGEPLVCKVASLTRARSFTALSAFSQPRFFQEIPDGTATDLVFYTSRPVPRPYCTRQSSSSTRITMIDVDDGSMLDDVHTQSLHNAQRHRWGDHFHVAPAPVHPQSPCCASEARTWRAQRLVHSLLPCVPSSPHLLLNSLSPLLTLSSCPARTLHRPHRRPRLQPVGVGPGVAITTLPQRRGRFKHAGFARTPPTCEPTRCR